MNLKTISSTVLLSELKSLVIDERRVTTKILHYLREVESRRLFEPRYTSLFDYCVEELKYSNDAAQRRIASMRLLKVMPELEQKIESGELSLAVVAKADSFFRAESKLRQIAEEPALNLEQKRAVMSELMGKSKRDAEDVLIARSINPVQKRALKIELSADDCAKLEKLRALFSHRLVENSVSAVVSLLLEEGLDKHDPARVAARSVTRVRSKSSVRPDEVTRAAHSGTAVAAEGSGERDLITSAPSARPFCGGPAGGLEAVDGDRSPASRYIPADVKRAVWLRDGGKCSAPGCGSTHYLQYDHRMPYALGGAHTVENLRLLCAAHNQRESVRAFGMRQFTPAPS